MRPHTRCLCILFIGALVSNTGGDGASFRTSTTTTEAPSEELLEAPEGTCDNFKGNVSRATYVSSPRYPYNYPDSLACDVIVYVPINYMVRLYFIDFSLESSAGCWLDHLEVTQQDFYGMNLELGRFCGHDMPPLVLGFQPSITLSFMADRYVNDRGFRARIEYIPLI